MKKYAAAAKELNDVLDLEPRIKTVGVKEAELKEKLLEAATLIHPTEDVISEETTAVLEELKQEGKAPAKKPAAKQPEPEPEPDETEDENMKALIEEIQEETELKPLKTLIKTVGAFKSLRKSAPGVFDIDDLKASMFECLGVSIPPMDNEDGPGEEKVEAPAKQKEKAEALPKKPKAAGAYTRIDSICDTLKTGKVKTMDELIRVSNDLYVEKGGKDNQAESRTFSRYVVKTLSRFDVDVNIPV